MSAPRYDQPFQVVHQILPSLHVADASGAHTLHARDALRAAGYHSEIFVQQADEPLRGECHRIEELDAHVVEHTTALVYQLCVGSTVVDGLMERVEPLIVNYHNLTPASFFWQWAPEWLDAVALGRNQLLQLRDRTFHAVAVSSFNERDLIGAGYRSTSVVAPFVSVGAPDTDGADRRPNPSDGGPTGATWLFVGKLLPHKAAHDVVKAFSVYRRVYDPDATLTLVGGHPVPAYAAAVSAFADRLGLSGAVELAGSVSDAQLAEAYRRASVFVCLSEHEGFCFPLLEAMARGVPIVALRAGAVADTLGDAGVLLERKNPSLVAAAAHAVIADPAARQRLADAGRRRLTHFDLEETKRAWAAEVTRILERVRRRQRELVVAGREAGRVVNIRVVRAPARRIQQVVPMAVPGDATTDHALQVRRLVRDLGLESEIFASAVHEDLEDDVHLLHEFGDLTQPGTRIVYQLSSASLMADWVLERREPVAVNYHNLTPAEDFDRWEPAVAADQRWGRRQLASLARVASLGIGDSAYNCAELVAAGYPRSTVVPILLDTARFDVAADEELAAELAERRERAGAHFLFVGRLTPHKGQHRLVQMLACYRKAYDAGARLTVVGRPGSMRYLEALRQLVSGLGLDGAVSIPGGIGHRELVAYYRDADVFVSASTHEGFCVPLLEAMHHGVPVVAHAAAAVPETLAGAGVLVDDVAPAHLAAAAHRVLSDPGTNKRLVDAGRVRLEDFSLPRTRRRMQAVLEDWMDAA